MASRNLLMKEWFLPTLTTAVRGRTRVTAEAVLVEAPPSLQDPEALNIP